MNDQQGLKVNLENTFDMDTNSFMNIDTILFKSCSIKPNPFITNDSKFKDRK